MSAPTNSIVGQQPRRGLPVMGLQTRCRTIAVSMNNAARINIAATIRRAVSIDHPMPVAIRRWVFGPVKSTWDMADYGGPPVSLTGGIQPHAMLGAA